MTKRTFALMMIVALLVVIFAICYHRSSDKTKEGVPPKSPAPTAATVMTSQPVNILEPAATNKATAMPVETPTPTPIDTVTPSPTDTPAPTPSLTVTPTSEPEATAPATDGSLGENQLPPATL